jgi:hypothetical protein
MVSRSAKKLRSFLLHNIWFPAILSPGRLNSKATHTASGEHEVEVHLARWQSKWRGCRSAGIANQTLYDVDLPSPPFSDGKNDKMKTFFV